MHRIESKTVDVEVPDPELGVLDRPLAHAGLPVVERIAPDRVVPTRDVRRERAQRLVAGADVVVDDVQQHGEAFRMRCVDETREPVGTAVRAMRGGQVEAVVPPATLAGEGRHGHQLDRSHAERTQASQTRDHGVERSLVRERADVELVDDEVVERDALPALVGPGERTRVDDCRRTSHAVRLCARARIGICLAAVDDESVLGTRNGGHASLPDTVADGIERNATVRHVDRKRTDARRPHPQLDVALVDRDRAECAPQRSISPARHLSDVPAPGWLNPQRPAA